MPYICPHIPTEVLRPPKGVDWFNFRFRITMTSVQAGYRHLLRACNKVFGNDPAAFNTALMSIREQVASKAGVTDAEQLKALTSQFYEAAEFLQHNIVQGNLTDEGNYAISPVPPREKGQGPFKLNLQSPSDAVASVEAQAEVEAQRAATGGVGTVTVHSGGESR